MLLKSIHLTNFLSFGPDAEPIELGPLNVVIGPNGSGKSNLLEAIELLHAAPRDFLPVIRQGGGVQEWLWKGGTRGTVNAEVTAELDLDIGRLRYALKFGESGQRFFVAEEKIDDMKRNNTVYWSARPKGGMASSALAKEMDPRKSILSVGIAPIFYSELSPIKQQLEQICLYRDWVFGPQCLVRRGQQPDSATDFLSSDFDNLALVLNRLREDHAAKKALLTALHALYEGIDDFGVRVEGGTVMAVLQEGNHSIPATRLSDGTLRYLCLLTILCHPDPPPLVCIEEPELGLHPDALRMVAKLLKDASTRTQLIVTTHSEILVNALSDCPEAVLVTEKDERGTRITRLDKDKLQPWLAEYRLGELWMRGDLGGVRW